MLISPGEGVQVRNVYSKIAGKFSLQIKWGNFFPIQTLIKSLLRNDCRDASQRSETFLSLGFLCKNYPGTAI